MKNLKFRIWDKQFKQFLYQLPEQHHLNWERFDVQQWTGLVDKGGKEIFAGDIIDFGGLKPIEIIWEGGRFKSSMFGSEPIKLAQEGLGSFGEVIGNVWQNPNLLKESIKK